jgi:hypothetical protein
MRLLRPLTGCSLFDRKSDDEIRQELNVTNITDLTEYENRSSYLWLYSPLLDLGCFFNFIIFYTVCRTPWKGDRPQFILMVWPKTKQRDFISFCHIMVNILVSYSESP